eukprot:NODE_2392_length_2221_cov_8.170010.p1 GENE.NODE_2392_length_2221_cov_8.170010~~NODE_2392_length_2221_cov_8.170010.p1  ORF type:complete len:633 (-),score=132.48 NODE_2392_length_2221_cov_8.170010:321-2165(-)
MGIVSERAEMVEQHVGYSLHASWCTRTLASPRSSRNSCSSLDLTVVKASHSIRLGCGSSAVEFIQNYIISQPNTRKRLVWETMMFLIILCDVILLPMQAFGTAAWYEFYTVLDFVLTCIFSFDIVLTFLVGFTTHEGIIEKRLNCIAVHYFKTWFSFDAVIVLCDWGSRVFVDSLSQNASYARLGRVSRFLRLLRLFRFVKAADWARQVSQLAGDEAAQIVLSLAQFISVLLLINHFIACAWYAIGSQSIADNGWVRHNQLERASLAMRYSTALHWSLTQFTPASMEVVPENEYERVFTVTVLVFAMVAFSTLISSITSATTQLRNLNGAWNSNRQSLKQYLVENSVHPAMAVHALKCLESQRKFMKTKLREKDVVLLQMLPYNLRIKIKLIVNTPPLRKHALFSHMLDTFDQVNLNILQSTISEVSINAGKTIFSASDLPDAMYFLCSGSAMYSGQDGNTIQLTAGNVFSESSLWLEEWIHTGCISSECATTLARIDRDLFAMAMRDDTFVFQYALGYLNLCNSRRDDLSDIYPDATATEELLQELLRATSPSKRIPDVTTAPFNGQECSASAPRGSDNSFGTDRGVNGAHNGASCNGAAANDVPGKVLFPPS